MNSAFQRPQRPSCGLDGRFGFAWVSLSNWIPNAVQLIPRIISPNRSVGIICARVHNKETSVIRSRALLLRPASSLPQQSPQVSYLLSSGNLLEYHGLLQVTLLARQTVVTATSAPQRISGEFRDRFISRDGSFSEGKIMPVERLLSA